jgi:hypothetical protein
VRDPRLTVDPDRHACSGQGLDTVRSRARRALVGDQLDIKTASLGADQRLHDARTVVRPRAPTRISRSALSTARTAKAAQSSSGEKQTAIAAPDVRPEILDAGRID